MDKLNQKTLKKPLRLNKFLSQRAGVSRREADRLIEEGKLSINGKKLSSGLHFVDPEKDTVCLKGRKILAKKLQPKVFMFHKPVKVLSSASDPKGRPTVMDYIKTRGRERLFPVGRLDWDSEGLLLLSNDGEFTDRVLHPRHKTFKSYLVKLKGEIEPKDIRKLLQGVSTPMGKKKALFACSLGKRGRRGSLAGSRRSFASSQASHSTSWLKLILNEGKKRQIRWMFERMGLPVQRLKRVAIGRLKLSHLARGSFRQLKEKEIRKIFEKPKELD